MDNIYTAHTVMLTAGLMDAIHKRRERERERGQLEVIERIGTRNASEQNDESSGVHNCR